MMKPAMDFDVGQVFEWRDDLYKVVQTVKDSSENIRVVRALKGTQWSTHEENFNSLCEVEEHKLMPAVEAAINPTGK